MPSKVPLRIVIVGGVAGGMSAATRARRLSETALITVFEKGPYVSYANCGLPYALGGIIKSESALILQTPETFKERFNIDVHVNSEVIAIDPIKKLVDVQTVGTEGVTQHRYDKLIFSQGSEPFKPHIEGINLPHVFTLQTIPDLQKIKSFISEHGSKSIAIIGGGFIGIEVADALHSLGGLKISIVEYTAHIFPLLDADITEPLHSEIRRNGINLLLNARIQRIEAGKESTGAHVVVAHGEPVPADIVLVCVGTRTRTALAHSAGLIIGKTGVTVNEFMQTSDPDIYAVGDMVETHHHVADRPLNIALAGPANRQGRLAADNIFGRKVAYRGNVGTSACKVFDLTVASTGLSVHTLKDMGREVQWVTVHPPDHAAYYPGASQMTLKVIFDPSTGKLLGAEAVGKSGIDKRIDVLSTALQAGMTIYDLEHLELAYAPPYGSAKDPVNMAGFVGSNVLRGDVEIVHPEELNLDDGDVEMEIVDVRSKKEFEGGHLRGARNLPINGLRESLEKGVLGNGKGRKVLVYCQVGYRGYLGYRILKQKGFKVVNLDGGYKSVAEGGFRGLQEGGLV
jgi:NADPH-dependent 2,4-dienoyl-CoA reductase/sulfur reductase-like enzyme/rhodanese-related sulfurtransferase